MTTKIQLFLCALAVAAPTWANVRAAEPTSPRPTGKVLVLDNERTLEGDIERVGEQYHVSRAAGETWVPRTKALCLYATLEEAYAFLRSQTNLNDADERLRLARWCFQHGLREQTLAEATEAV